MSAGLTPAGGDPRVKDLMQPAYVTLYIAKHNGRAPWVVRYHRARADTPVSQVV